MGNQSSRSKIQQPNATGVVKQGWLELENIHYSEAYAWFGWKQHWVVIDNHALLSCYKDDTSESLQSPTIQLDLSEYKCCNDSQKQKSKADYFHIDLKHIYYSKQILKFRTQSKSDHKEWITQLGKLESDHVKDHNNRYISTEQLEPRQYLVMMQHNSKNSMTSDISINSPSFPGENLRHKVTYTYML